MGEQVVEGQRGWGHRARFLLAVTAARATAAASRFAGHHASALPGLVAERIDPDILDDLASRLGPIAIVLGTNGKTTTTRLIATILEGVHGVPPVTNPSGANLRQGVITSMLGRRNGAAVKRRLPAVFEVDELAFAGLVDSLRPSVVVMLNLLRDQLDRYGEIDYVQARWAGDLARLPLDTVLVTCADDTRIESLAMHAGLPVRRFGLEQPGSDEHRGSVGKRAVTPTVDASTCPACGAPVRFVIERMQGLGTWICPSCRTTRQALDLAVAIEQTDRSGWLRLRLRKPSAPSATVRSRARIRLDGSAGGYDAAAATLAVEALGVELDAAIGALDGATPAFGRLEELALGAKRVVLTLAKNPVSLAQVVESAATRRPDGLLIGLGDRPADGRDPSWIWDADLDRFASIAPITLTGSRVHDLALRFKYGMTAEGGRVPRLRVDGVVSSALDTALESIRPGGTLMILATYTSLLGIRHQLERRGALPAIPG
ncbi:MAG TPA: MurT ligase domain-containing protein [Candidatus Limnocylindrales bacterium]|nr:MurT ligase domain-containing protein [Candidatus Limnocylindrales bacterium]